LQSLVLVGTANLHKLREVRLEELLVVIDEVDGVDDELLLVAARLLRREIDTRVEWVVREGVAGLRGPLT
jgi:hypothetical protein